MAERATSSDPRAERVRRQIKAAAWSLAHESRIDSISVSDIVKRSGASRPAFYLHFTDRDDAITSAVIDAIGEAVGTGSDHPEKAIGQLMRFVIDNVELYRNLYPSLASQRCARAFRASLRPACQTIVRELRGPKSSLPHITDDVLTSFLLGGLMEILIEWAESPSSRSPDTQAETLLHAFGVLTAGCS